MKGGKDECAHYANSVCVWTTLNLRTFLFKCILYWELWSITVTVQGYKFLIPTLISHLLNRGTHHLY